MLIIVKKKPILFTMVSAVALISEGALFATNVEKSGESAITTIPQNSRKVINKLFSSIANISGDKKQQAQDKNKASEAMRLVPKFCAR